MSHHRTAAASWAAGETATAWKKVLGGGGSISLSYTYVIKIFILFLSLECAKGLHLYAGRCYRRCPDGTYASEVLTERSSRRRNFTILEGATTAPLVMKRQGDRPTATEALDMEPGSTTQVKAPLICLPCHYTCATCSGPHNSQCVSCLDDAELYNDTGIATKIYCYPKTVLPHINNANWHYKVNIGLSIVLFIIGCVALYILVVCLLRRCGFSYYNSNINVAYNKLASDEKKVSAFEIEDEINQALKDSSDSESDDDLNL